MIKTSVCKLWHYFTLSLNGLPTNIPLILISTYVISFDEIHHKIKPYIGNREIIATISFKLHN